ncbi:MULTISPECIES: 30S ribosomal protein S20 [Cyanophyceae]|uniref:Small ribosomal subunit protein bS20 n=1 Tax=Picosynechococcus sp. (strain ATCC 27264 / PCC 7002 / PR-6) TaxID=32049 RepID=RS20_PICP2|nr:MULTISPECIES: 30S ribosomal protein S20 [Cyanophyceae]B1XHW6.1 RecName: Full=Small ribosomal subunit protein bS20; AltName: Full=30S ribosomal protein S20 [Picosynechococcus sp. PCC 7002]ACB00035.1 30S ribosomal protein S20 [Picosynechococcus sp. PCC 7002]AMA09674.1 30S ribosomal protein S20 [Picosynechococcus sp. PCC 73109]ANV87838.1 30S ribosomal protein S20 [Picosynechococcus sp. PCC 7117]ANV91031.1 30S ribosomal protein S20 [Picosynechococcus sp. PCC 8807]QCS50541.1 30S ribosomal prote
MANIKSAIKRIQTAERNRLRNKSYKSAVKTLTKKCLQAIEQYAAAPSADAQAEAQKYLSATYSKIDKAVKRGVYHHNTAARKKARLAKEFKQATGQVAA